MFIMNPSWWLSPRTMKMYEMEVDSLSDMCMDLGEDHPDYIAARADFIRRGGHSLYENIVEGPYTSEYPYPEPWNCDPL